MSNGFKPFMFLKKTRRAWAFVFFKKLLPLTVKVGEVADFGELNYQFTVK